MNRLRAALSGRIPAPQVEDTVNYYVDYINVEMRKGRSEEEVLNALGDPRLIARTIIQTNDSADSYGMPGGYQEEGFYEQTEGSGFYQDDYDGFGGRRRIFRIPGWLLAILVILLVVLVMSVVFSVLSFLAPIIIVMAAVIFMIKLFRDWLN